MSKSIDILIEADNQASKTFEQVTKDIDTNVKNIKSVGEKAKKSTEFVGVLANALGGSELGSYAQQLAQVTEKVSQFSEVSKAGGAGALAFKAGLVAVVAVAAFQVGKALGDVIFETKKWTDELAEAEAKALKLAEALAKVSERRFGMMQAENAAIRDPAERMQASKDQLAAIEQEIESKNKIVLQLKADAAKALDEESQWGDDIFGFNSKRVAESKKLIDDTEKSTELLRTQRDVLIDMTSERAQALETLKQENALKDKSDSYLEGLRKEVELLESKDKITAKAGQNTFGDAAAKEAQSLLARVEAVRLLEEATKKQEQADKDAAKAVEDTQKKSDDYIAGLRAEIELLSAKKEEVAGVTAGQNTANAEDRGLAEQLIKERDALKQKQDEETKAVEKKKQDAERIADLKQSELDKLAEERILLTQGSEAAHAFNLEKQGLSREDAKQIARQQTINDKLKARQSGGGDSPLQASETRLLTRGSDDLGSKMLQATIDTNGQIQLVATILGTIATNTAVTLEAV